MKTFCLFAGLALTLACLKIVEGHQLAFALADRPLLASYTPNPLYSSNAEEPVTIEKYGTGLYQVKFGRLASHGAHSQVTMFGTLAGHCTINGWSSGTVKVGCFDGNGARANRKFTVLSMKACGDDDELISYAFLNSQTSIEYTPNPTYRFGDGTHRTLRASTGTYRVNLGSVANRGGVVLTSTFQSNRICNMRWWSGGDTILQCRNNAGSFSDTRATVLGIKAGIQHASFLYSSTTDGFANPSYSYSSNGSAQSVRRTAVGRYTVTIGPEANRRGHVQVVAFDSRATCGIVGWSSGNVQVSCRHRDVFTDARFVIVAFN